MHCTAAPTSSSGLSIQGLSTLARPHQPGCGRLNSSSTPYLHYIQRCHHSTFDDWSSVRSKPSRNIPHRRCVAEFPTQPWHGSLQPGDIGGTGVVLSHCSLAPGGDISWSQEPAATSLLPWNLPEKDTEHRTNRAAQVVDPQPLNKSLFLSRPNRTASAAHAHRLTQLPNSSTALATLPA